MKKSFVILTFVGVLILSLGEIQAQKTETKPNLSELMKQFIGTWKCKIGENATFLMEGKSFYNGIEFYWKTEANGNVIVEGKSLFGYDSKNERILDFQIVNNSKDVIIWAGRFTSPNIYEAILLQDISNPEKANEKWKYEFKSSSMLVCTYTKNNISQVFPLTKEN
jgi:hypothetical protein